MQNYLGCGANDHQLFLLRMIIVRSTYMSLYYAVSGVDRLLNVDILPVLSVPVYLIPPPIGLQYSVYTLYICWSGIATDSGNQAGFPPILHYAIKPSLLFRTKPQHPYITDQQKPLDYEH